MKYRSALAMKNVAKVQKVVLSWPYSSERLSRVAQLWLKNSLNDQALVVTKKAVEFNPDNLNSWITMLSNPQASKADLLLAKSNLIRLDPRTPEWKKIVTK